jgi:hypothetical protein
MRKFLSIAAILIMILIFSTGCDNGTASSNTKAVKGNYDSSNATKVTLDDSGITVDGSGAKADGNVLTISSAG